MSTGALKLFYGSARWKKCRNAFYKSKFGLCERCNEKGEEVHHKDPITEADLSNNPSKLFDWNNLELLCRKCHETTRVRSPGGIIFDKQGDIVIKSRDNRIVIVWGSPASGKTTYVKANKGPRDIVIDLDYIISSLTLRDNTETSGNAVVLPIALDIRNYIYSLLERRKFIFGTAWIIALLPKRYERTFLQKRLNAEMMHIDTNKNECIARAEMDATRTDKALQRKLIEKFFDDLELDEEEKVELKVASRANDSGLSFDANGDIVFR